jgi:hypothetical protein
LLASARSRSTVRASDGFASFLASVDFASFLASDGFASFFASVDFASFLASDGFASFLDSDGFASFLASDGLGSLLFSSPDAVSWWALSMDSLARVAADDSDFASVAA